MRIVVVTSDVPFVEGGHRVIARSLVEALRREGHTADLVTTPQNRFGRQLSAYLATWLTDVGVGGDGGSVERVISLRFPSYAVRHPRHVVWLNHRMREYYDLWDDHRARLGPRARLVETVRRKTLHVLDRRLLGRCHEVFAQSGTIRDRLRRWGGIDAEVVYPPAPRCDYRNEGYDGHVLSVSRLTSLKRVDLLLDAAAVDDGIRVRVAGDGPEAANLRAQAARLGITERVEFLGRVPDEDLLGEYARCSAVWFGPRAEDYGLVTLEAFRSGKAVVTCSDSGGPAEIVRDGVNGRIVEPDPRAIAAALGPLSREADLARALGEEAAKTGGRHSWSAVVTRLLGG